MLARRPTRPHMPSTTATRFRGSPALMLALGCTGSAALWTLLSLALSSQCSWMAVLAGLDSALMLRLTRVRPGMGRAAGGVLGTLAAVVAANWMIAAANLGPMFGLTPWESALRLGAHHAWTLAGLANGPVDLAWLAAGLVVAAVAAR